MTGNIFSRTRRYLSWIEDLTTNQGVIGSNPIRRTTQIMTTRIAGGLLLGYNPKVPGQGLKPLA